jgi:DNA invertase Pin-like site-specific DNA recombinase
MTSTPLRLDGIVRVSKTGEREYLRSPDQQEADLRRWAADNGHTLDRVHVAIDASAGHGSHPAIEAAKERALSGAVDGIVAPYLSRFTRHVVYGLETVEELLNAGRHFFALDCPFDLRTKEGERYFTGVLTEARYEWRVRKDNFARGVSEAIERGVHIGVPFGYRRSNGKGSTLAVEPDEAALVRQIFEWRVEGWSWERIANAANKRGPLPRARRWKRGEEPRQSPWNQKTVRGLLYGDGSKLRRVYLGVALNGEHETPNAHPAIVDSALFERATRAKGLKFASPKGANPDGYLLSGFVRCAGCGYVMTYQGRDQLRCRTAQQASADCPAPAGCPALPLEEFVTKQYALWATDMLASVDVSDSAHDEARAKVRDIETRLDSLMVQAERMSGRTQAIQARFDAQVDSVERELADAQAEEARTAAIADRPIVPVEDFADLPLDEQRKELSAIFDFVILRRAEIYREPVMRRTRIVWANEAPQDAAGRIAFARTLPW